MEGIQAIYQEYDDYYDEEFIIYLAPMKIVVNENNVGTFVVTDDCKYVFNIGEDGSLTAADPETLLGVCVHTLNEDLEGNDVWIWKGFGDRDIKMTPADGKFVQLPDGIQTEYWVWSDGDIQAFTEVAIDGDDFYVNGMDRSLPEAWIKGKISDGKVTFPSGQYLGADMEIYYYSYFCGAEFSDEEDEDGEIIRVASLADNTVFSYDAEKKSITTEQGYIINSTADRLFPLYFYENADVAMQNRNPEAAPKAPYDLEYFESDWGNSIWFQLPNVDVDGNILMENKLFYEIYVDDVLQEFTIYDEDGSEVKTSLIPYAYDDWNDFWVAGEDHTVYIYTDVVNSIAVRSVYINENDEEVYSDMCWYGDSGVDAIDGQKRVVSEKWYDLQGRSVNGPAAGVEVKVATYSDGTVKRSKVMSVK